MLQSVTKKIGIATVYRMVSALEEVGVISRKIVYASESEQRERRS